MGIRARINRWWLAALGVAVVGVVSIAGAQAAKTLDVYFIDVDGGHSVLVVSPGGESFLIDSGGAVDANEMPTPRDADRILHLAKDVIGLKQLDYLVTTHYHTDHVSQVPRIVASLPVKTFVDHGDFTIPEIEGKRMVGHYNDYLKVRPSGRHLEPKPGDRLSLAGDVDVTFIGSKGRVITKALKAPGAGKPNPLCAGFVKRPEENTLVGSLKGENAASVAEVITYGKFRLLDVGDRMWNQEPDLVCPNNLVGEVSAYVTAVHGVNLGGSATWVHAIRPRIIFWNNGPVKASREPFDVLKSSPGLEDIWQNHYAVPRPPNKGFGEVVDQGGPASNVADEYIANLTGKDVVTSMGKTQPVVPHDDINAAYIKLSARKDGSFSVTNTRTGVTKQYARSRPTS